jgi:hypothetical protein
MSSESGLEGSSEAMTLMGATNLNIGFR